MKKNLCHKILAFLLIIGMTIPYFGIKIDAGYNQSFLIDSKKTVSFWQNGAELDSAAELNEDESFQMKMTFPIPVKGDGVSQYVEKGDNATIWIGKITPFDLIERIYKDFERVRARDKDGNSYILGDVKIRGDEYEESVKVEFAFNGDKNLYNGYAKEVVLEISLDMKLNREEVKKDKGIKTLSMLGKTYSFKEFYQYFAEISVDAEEGKYLDQNTWAVRFKGQKLESGVWTDEDLAGKWIRFQLTSPDKIAVDLETIYLNGIKIEAEDVKPMTELGAIVGFKYKLPLNSKGEQVLKISSKVIDRSRSFATGEDLEIGANFYLYQQEPLATSEFEHNYLAKAYLSAFIRGQKMTEKIGLDIVGDQIRWAVIVNHGQESLRNVKITENRDDDYLADYDFIEAKLEEADFSGGTEVWQPTAKNWSVEPDDGVYQLGDINKKVRLVLTLKLKTVKPEYNNNAKVSWDGAADIPLLWGKYYHFASKTDIVRKEFDRDFPRSSKNEQWKIFIAKEDLAGLAEPRLLDFFINDKSFYEAVEDKKFGDITVTGLGALNLKEAFQALMAEKPLQQYIGNVRGLEAGSVKEYPIMLGGREVGRIVEFKNYKTADWNFSFQSQGLNEIIVERSKSFKNVVLLYDATELQEVETAYGTKLTRWLFKDVLMAKQAEKFLSEMSALNGGPLIDENGLHPEPGDSPFNYQNYSIIYRLHLSNLGMDNLFDRVGKMTIADQLPEGWEFDLIGGQPFVAFRAMDQNDFYDDDLASMNPFDSLLTSIPNLSLKNAADLKGKNRAEFEIIGNLSGSYIIYLKAKPTEAKMQQYLKGKPKYDGDLAYFEVENKLIGSFAGGEIRRNNISRLYLKVLQKNLLPKEGALQWQIDYTPYALKTSAAEVWLIDTLPKRIELRRSESGKLGQAPNFTLHEMNMDINGKLSLGAAVPLVEGENLKYESSSRKLRLKLPNKEKSYRFQYITDIKPGEAGELQNIVELEASDIEVEAGIRKFWLPSIEIKAHYEPTKAPEKPKVEKPKPDPFVPTPEKPTPHYEVPENEVPKSPSVKDGKPEDKNPHEELDEDKIPKGKKELPKTAGLPAGFYMGLGLVLGLGGLTFKRRD